MRFPSDDARRVAVDWFQATGPIPDAEFVQDDEGDSLVLEQAQSGDAAVARTTVLLQGAFGGSDHEASDVALSWNEWA